MPAAWSASRSWTGSAWTSVGSTTTFFLLFDRAATWGSDFPRPVSSGAPVIANSVLVDGAAGLLR
jgi:hypothetical protein